MLYCPKCQLLNDSDADRCPACGSKKLRTPEPDDPVLLMTADEVKVGMIRAVFEENGIIFVEQDSGFGSPPSMLLGKHFYGNRNIYVACRDLQTAKELINGVGIADAADAELQRKEDEEAGVQPQDPALDDETEPETMSSRKRFFWRIISAMLFILVVWGVVAAADFVANALKALFANG
nr:DUF2007 domain-containing protein [uncultured Caproiciproducens sp.]